MINRFLTIAIQILSKPLGWNKRESELIIRTPSTDDSEWK